MAQSPPEATRAPVEAIARTLVLGTLPALEATVSRGFPYSRAMADAWAHLGDGWRARYGDEVAARAREILGQVGPAEILTRSGRDSFVRRYPVDATQLPPPPEAIAPPPGGILWRAKRALVSVLSAPIAARD
jgi:hypothetical protein